MKFYLQLLLCTFLFSTAAYAATSDDEGHIPPSATAAALTTRAANAPLSLADMPQELLENICRFLDAQGLCRLAQTSKGFRACTLEMRGIIPLDSVDLKLLNRICEHEIPFPPFYNLSRTSQVHISMASNNVLALASSLLPGCHNLRLLDFSFNPSFGDEGANSLGPVLPNLLKLEGLHLSASSISLIGVEGLIQKPHPTLRVLLLGGGPIGVGIGRVSNTIKIQNPEETARLATILTRCPALTMLNLANNDIHPDRIAQLKRDFPNLEVRS